jgi:hypothetical protein
MIRRYLILLNGFLIVLCLVFVERISHVWREVGEGKASKVVSEKPVLLPEYRVLENRTGAPNAYQVVVAKDLFRPERTEWKPPVGDKEQEVAKKPAPQISIFGIVIAGDRKQAWIQDPKSAGKLRKISLGEDMDGWKVSTITPNVVSLTCGGETKTYRLIEEGKPKARAVPKAATPPPAPKAIPHALPPPAPQSSQPPQGGAPPR